MTLHRRRVHCFVAIVLEWFCCCVCSKHSIYSSQDCRLLYFDVYFLSCTTFYSVPFFFHHFVSLLQSYCISSSNSLLLISLIITSILLTIIALMISPSPFLFSPTHIFFSIFYNTLGYLVIFLSFQLEPVLRNKIF